jgi:chromosome segregation ATPase
MHVVLVPLQKKQLKKRRTKEQISKNIQAETYESVTLNARDMFDKTALSQLQTDYAAALELLGINRGIKHSRSKNKPLKKYYSEIASPQNRLKFDYPVIEKPPIFNAQNWVDENNQNIKQAFEKQQKEIQRLQNLTEKYKARYENERNKIKYISENFADVDDIRKRISDLERDNANTTESYEAKLKTLENRLHEAQELLSDKDAELLAVKKRYHKLKNKLDFDNENDLTH